MISFLLLPPNVYKLSTLCVHIKSPDVYTFGVMTRLFQMIRHSTMTIRLDLSDLPFGLELYLAEAWTVLMRMTLCYQFNQQEEDNLNLLYIDDIEFYVKIISLIVEIFGYPSINSSVTK